MTWKQFVKQWRPVTLTRLGVPHRTVYDWHAGTKEPRGWMMEAAALWIEHKAGKPDSDNPPNQANPKKG